MHPSTIYPGGVGTVATPTLFTDFLTRLLRCLDFIKKSVAMNDDIFDFFYEALPGYEEVGRRRVQLGCWGAFQDPDKVTYQYSNLEDAGNAMFVTPGVVVDDELLTTSLKDINLGIRIMLGSSYYDDWTNEETSSRRTRSATRSTSATPGTRRRSPSRRSATSRAATTRGS